MSNRKLQILWTREFASAIYRMSQVGGQKQKAGEKVKALIGGAELSEDPFVQASRGLIQKDDRIGGEPDWTKQILIDRMLQADRDRFLDNVPSRLVPRLLGLTAGVMPDEILRLAQEIPHPVTATLVFDVLTLLNSGDVDGAVARIDLESGALTPVSKLSPDEILEVADGDSIKRIPIGSPDYQKHIAPYLESAHYFGWFLFMHAEQQRQVDADHAGSAKLSGVSGSGKTCVAVKRAVRLASSSPVANVGVITLNRSLATLIQRLVEFSCPDFDVRGRIKVISFFEHTRGVRLDSQCGSTGSTLFLSRYSASWAQDSVCATSANCDPEGTGRLGDKDARGGRNRLPRPDDRTGQAF
jgi:hypothetical protein